MTEERTSDEEPGRSLQRGAYQLSSREPFTVRGLGTGGIRSAFASFSVVVTYDVDGLLLVLRLGTIAPIEPFATWSFKLAVIMDRTQSLFE